MKILQVALAVILLLAAAVQLNDPDPLYWTVVYAAAAAVVAGSAFGRFERSIASLVTGAVLAGMLWSAAGFLAYLKSGDYGSIFGGMLASKPYVEETREFLGLAIALGALALGFRGRRSHA